MVDKDELIREFGLQDVPADVQDAIIDDFTLELGAAMNDGLSDAQLDEFNRITDGDQPTIDGWLAANEPDYRNDPDYQQLEVGYREDPDKVPADKVYASMAWIRHNRPDYEQVVARVKREFREMIAAASADA